jgi:low temperature requirement protein LtrA
LPQDKTTCAGAAAFVFMQVGRSLFMLWALKRHDDANYRNFQRVTVWLCVSGLFWIAGGLAERHARLGLWASAVAIEYVSPAVFMCDCTVAAPPALVHVGGGLRRSRSRGGNHRQTDRGTLHRLTDTVPS